MSTYNSSLFPNNRQWNPVRLFEALRDREISSRTWAQEVREMLYGGNLEEAREACRLLWDNDLEDEVSQDHWDWIDRLFVDRNFKWDEY